MQHIYLVVGYLKEKFTYLKDKYPNVDLIENKECAYKNNISSIYASLALLGTGDCFITEGDLVVSDPSFLQQEMEQSTVFGKFCPSRTDEWCYHTQNGRLVHLGIGGENEYTTCGFTYLKRKDSLILADAIREAYRHPGHEQLFWDNVLDENLDKIRIQVLPVRDDQTIEIDTLEELKAADPSYSQNY